MKHEFDKLDLSLFHYQLDNKMQLYVIPNPNVNNIYVTFNAIYGSIHNEFKSSKTNKMIKVPDGIAHFLEHKMFEQPDGVDPFSFFNERGADVNANTSNFKTTYLFSGVDYFEENLNYLLDFVQTPYFTDENTEKEKGIIEQELRMYHDDPGSRILKETLFNLFSKHPVRIDIGGTIKSINQITKEHLYECYNTFYHPANMFIVVSGNVKPDDVYKIVKENQQTRNFNDDFKLELKKIKEPKEAFKTKSELKMNVSIPKSALAFKIDISNLKKYDLIDLVNYLLIFFEIKLSSTSLEIEELKNQKIITNDFSCYYLILEKYFVYYIENDTKEPEKLLNKLKEILNNLNITEEEFERKKKVYLSNYVLISDNIFSVNNFITDQIIKYDQLVLDIFNKIENYKINDLKEILSKINLNVTTETVILPKVKK